MKSGLFFLPALLVAGTVGTADADTYAVQANDDGSFGIVDLNTGEFTQTGSSPVIYSDFGISGGSLYSGAFRESGFYKINPVNGVGTLIGSTGLDNFATGSSSAGVFELDTSGNLYSINTSNGAATLIGSTGIGSYYALGMSNSYADLYVTYGYDIYEINTSTAVATHIGTTGTIALEGVALIGGDGWGVSNEQQIVGFTQGGLTGTVIAETGVPSGVVPFALGPTLVPEPSTWAMMLAGFASLGFAGYRASRRSAAVAS